MDATGSAAHLVSRRYAWGAFALAFALASTDYIDRQIIVCGFPYLKTEWGLSDSELGALMSVVSIVIAVCALPAARIADRWGRVKTIAAMGGLWSLATIGCAVSGNYAQLLAGRSLLGLGEAGYGAAGGALLSSYFPRRSRATVLSAFQAAGPLGSVLGVLLGGLLVEQWGWRVGLAAFGVPGLVLAVLFLKVRDYRTPVLTARASLSAGGLAGAAEAPVAVATTRPGMRVALRELMRPRTARACYVGGALNLMVLSTVYTWLPSYLVRAYGLSTDQAGAWAALVILAGFAGSIGSGYLADRRAARRPAHKLLVPSVLAVVTAVLLCTAFGALAPGGLQFALVLVGGFPLAAALGTAPAAVVDVVPPSLRATAFGMVALVQNLLGLAVGPLLTGWLSDGFGLRTALAAMPLFCVAAAAAFWWGSRSYDSDLAAVTGSAAAPTAPLTRETEWNG
ncbi:MFS transporter [Streptomyces sp. RS10V-4]|uniref:MFS transporter n=1 Tax=Streptomyces rhizoryzae TaxID=2932493 RepID=UPI002006A190|nr:MFS transporter [Streptomyces rhizoryzae]MCK7621636.1 MFS transporter [Streptomyces rhizoryzae]